MDGFENFVREVEPKLRHALVATYGAARGREAVAEALAWAWEHWDRMDGIDNPVGYLYRVGQSRTRAFLGRGARLAFPLPADVGLPWVEPGLAPALASLSEQQRVCVVLVHGMEWTLSEVAALLGIAKTSVQNHLDRGLARLRHKMEVACRG